MISSGLLSLLILVLIHVYANRASVLGWVWHGRFLSFASGISLSYVFVDLLPALERGTPILKRTFEHVLPYLDRHAYLIALFGILFYYGIESREPTQKSRPLQISGYLLFNFFVGASLSNPSDPEIQPLALYTIAIGMHDFVRDHLSHVTKERPLLFLLVGMLVGGYGVGYLTQIPEAVTAIAISFVAGGIILNIFRYELPKREKGNFVWFALGALLYTSLLLSLGEVKL